MHVLKHRSKRVRPVTSKIYWLLLYTCSTEIQRVRVLAAVRKQLREINFRTQMLATHAAVSNADDKAASKI